MGRGAQVARPGLRKGNELRQTSVDGRSQSVDGVWNRAGVVHPLPDASKAVTAPRPGDGL